MKMREPSGKEFEGKGRGGHTSTTFDDRALDPVEVSVMALEPVNELAYAVVRFRLVARVGWRAATAREAFTALWDYTTRNQLSHQSNVRRKLNAFHDDEVASAHAHKTANEIINRSINVLIIPPGMYGDKRESAQMLGDAIELVLPTLEWRRYLRWLHGQCHGGVLEREPFPKEARVVRWTNKSYFETAYARIHTWLNEELPIYGIEPWGVERDARPGSAGDLRRRQREERLAIEAKIVAAAAQEPWPPED